MQGPRPGLSWSGGFVLSLFGGFPEEAALTHLWDGKDPECQWRDMDTHDQGHTLLQTATPPSTERPQVNSPAALLSRRSKAPLLGLLCQASSVETNTS